MPEFVLQSPNTWPWSQATFPKRPPKKSGSLKAGVTLLFATKERRHTQRCFLINPNQTKPDQ